MHSVRHSAFNINRVMVDDIYAAMVEVYADISTRISTPRVVDMLPLFLCLLSLRYLLSLTPQISPLVPFNLPNYLHHHVPFLSRNLLCVQCCNTIVPLLLCFYFCQYMHSVIHSYIHTYVNAHLPSFNRGRERHIGPLVWWIPTATSSALCIRPARSQAVWCRRLSG